MVFYFLIIIFSVFINLQEFLIGKLEFQYVSYVDELFLIFPYLLAPFVVRKRSDAWVFLILLLPFLSIAHAWGVGVFVFYDVRFYEIVVQSFINFKFFLYFVFFYCLWLMAEKNSRVFVVAFLSCAAFSILGYVLNIIFPEYFVFSEASWHLERGRIGGFQFKPNDLAISLCFLMVFVLFSFSRGLGRHVLVFLLIGLIYLASSRTALLVALIIFLLSMFYERRYVSLFFLGGGGVCVLLAFHDAVFNSFLFSETVSNFSQLAVVGDTQYIRAIMVYYGVLLGVMFFPLGSGAASYGSVMSEGSLIYQMLGLSEIEFFQWMEGIYDSNAASIVGEYGFLGFLVFFGFAYKIVSQLLGGRRSLVFSLVFLLFAISLTQPLFSYQVNSINFLLLLFSLSYFLKGASSSFDARVGGR